MIALKDVKLYLHVDGSEEDPLIQTFIDSAKALILEQTGKTKKVTVTVVDLIEMTTETAIEETDLFNLAVQMLVAHWFYNRGVEGDPKKTISYSADLIISHIKLSGEYQ